MYAHVTIIEEIRMFISYKMNKNFNVYRMDVKSAFLNGELEEEVYIEKHQGFSLLEDKDMVCRLKKDLYDVKKAPRTWYARLDSYLEKLGFAKGTIDSSLYLKEVENGLLIIVVFFYDVIFGGNDVQQVISLLTR